MIRPVAATPTSAWIRRLSSSSRNDWSTFRPNHERTLSNWAVLASPFLNRSTKPEIAIAPFALLPPPYSVILNSFYPERADSSWSLGSPQQFRNSAGFEKPKRFQDFGGDGFTIVGPESVIRGPFSGGTGRLLGGPDGLSPRTPA